MVDAIARAARALEPDWSDERARAAFAALERKRRRRTIARVGAIALIAVALVGLNALRDPRLVRFADRSTARLFDGDSVVRAGTVAPDRVVALLDRGGARFEVLHDPARRFRVEAGEVAVEDLGTVFTVERTGAHARVAVERGRVRVSWPGGEQLLEAGAGGLFPPVDEVAALFAAADRARLEHAPERAIAPLEQIVDAHADDRRAPLAAFTLGRVYRELGRRREAADAFARARALDPNGPLAADARAHELAP
jgi:ferric-dicitrate binding protein FerR (iron transport regulator)